MYNTYVISQSTNDNASMTAITMQCFAYGAIRLFSEIGGATLEGAGSKH